MKTIVLKTNIMCGSCIEKVTPALNAAVGEGNWQVDTQTPEKQLTVRSEDKNPQDIIEAVQSAGYKAEPVS